MIHHHLETAQTLKPQYVVLTLLFYFFSAFAQALSINALFNGDHVRYVCLNVGLNFQDMRILSEIHGVPFIYKIGAVLY